MWTLDAFSGWSDTMPFQSLSRDSVHVDPIAHRPAHNHRRGFNPSVGIPSMWTFGSYTTRFIPAGVSIPQSGFRPCGPGVAPAVKEPWQVSIPQSGFRPCGLWSRIGRLLSG